MLGRAMQAFVDGNAEQAKAIMLADENTKDIRDDWRQRVPVIRPVFAEAEARQAGVSRNDLASSLQAVTSGILAGVYREDDTLLPIIFKLPEDERSTVGQLGNTQVWSSSTGRAVPIAQVTTVGNRGRFLGVVELIGLLGVGGGLLIAGQLYENGDGFENGDTGVWLASVP